MFIISRDVQTNLLIPPFSPAILVIATEIPIIIYSSILNALERKKDPTRKLIKLILKAVAKLF